MVKNANTGEYIEKADFENISSEKMGLKARMEKFLASRYLVAVCILLVAIISFALGRISAIEGGKEGVKVISKPNSTLNIEQTAAVGVGTTVSGETVVASKNGTKYHYPWCAGAKQIAEKNKVIFDSIKNARAAGFTPAANCQGLK